MMDVMVLENALDGAWNHSLRLMAGKCAMLDRYPLPGHATVKRYEDDIRLKHLDAEWKARELIRVPVDDGRKGRVDQGGSQTRPYRLVMAWWIGEGKVSAAMVEAGAAWALVFGVDPEFAFIRAIPAGVDEFVEVKGICLVQAGWVPKGFLAVSSGGMTRNLLPYKIKDQVMA